MGSLRITAAGCSCLPLFYLELVLVFFLTRRRHLKRVLLWLALSSCSFPLWSLQASSPPLATLQGHQSQDFCHCLDQMRGSQVGFSSSSPEQGGSSKESLAASRLVQGSFGL